MLNTVGYVYCLVFVKKCKGFLQNFKVKVFVKRFAELSQGVSRDYYSALQGNRLTLVLATWDLGA